MEERPVHWRQEDAEMENSKKRCQVRKGKSSRVETDISNKVREAVSRLRLLGITAQL